MIGSVILPGTRVEDWPAVRREIHDRISATMGTAPPGAGQAPVEYKEIERYRRFDLTHVKVRYHVVDDEWHEAIIVLPEGDEKALPAPAVICMHGTFGRVEGKYAVLDPAISATRAYGIELPKRGYVTIATDVYAFGETLHGRTNPEAADDFYKKYPEWSLDGRRILDHARALDVLEKLGWVKEGMFGAIGDSLGGRGVMFLTAFDERVKAAVSSTGISPNCSNVYRDCTGRETSASPKLRQAILTNGKMPWDYHEMVALCAPRAYLALEPFNDKYNTDVWPTFQSVYWATEVYKLLGHAERLAILVHGDGHDTPPDMRRFAYDWFDRFLKKAW